MGARTRDTFDAAAAELFHAFAHGDDTAAVSSAAGKVADRLRRVLERGYGLSTGEAEETAQDVMLKVLELAHEPGALDEIANPPAFLMRLARNRAIDRLRRSSREDVELSPELASAVPGHDDAIAALLDATATAASVQDAMRAADAAEDHSTLEIVRLWLDMADELDTSPTSREVADRAGVSHTSVNSALKRFRTYFPVDQEVPAN